MGKGSSAPAPPDPYETAAAEAQFNRPDVYAAGGGGVRQGYTVPSGDAPEIEVSTNFNSGGIYGNNGDPSVYGGGVSRTFKVGDRSFTNREEAEAYQDSLRTGETRFVEGVAPEGYNSATKYVESPTEKAMRELMEPASLSLAERMIDDNVTNLPDRAEVRDRSDVAQDLYDRSYSMMEPQIEQQQERLLNSMQARGMPVGSEGFNDVQGEFNRETQDTLSRLAMDANIRAGQEQTREYQTESAERQGAMAEIAALLGGQYQPPNPMPNGAGQSNVNYSALVGQQYDAQMANYQAKQQQRANTWGTIGSIAGGLIMKSSEASKDVGAPLAGDFAARAVNGLKIKNWTYKGDQVSHVGPMAEDWQEQTGLGDGKTIHLGDAVGILTGALQQALQRIEVLEAQAGE